MPSVNFPSGAPSEGRGLSHWMGRSLKELDRLLEHPDSDAVHDLRVALRRCRSLASTLSEVDSDRAWHRMRKTAKALFRRLGQLRDTQVMEEWVDHLGPEGDPVRLRLHADFELKLPGLLQDALQAARKFDRKEWQHLERHLARRARLVPPGGLAAECLALERLETACELHSRALRSEKPRPWHELRIALKRFRYTTEALLPVQYEAWSGDLKRLQDLLGEIHDLDVLADLIRSADAAESDDASPWSEILHRERRSRVDTYRQLTLGKTGLLQLWRHALPSNGRLETAVMARVRATARARDPHPRRTAQTSRVALGLFDALARSAAAPLFEQMENRRILRVAARLHGAASHKSAKHPQRAARKFLLTLPLPPGWTPDEWNLVAWVLRYHRGSEPKRKHCAFHELSPGSQRQVAALAGILRLARALRKSCVHTGVGIRAAISSDVLSLRIPQLDTSAHAAARLAAAKHLLESALNRPLVLQPAEPASVLPLKPLSIAPAQAENTEALASD